MSPSLVPCPACRRHVRVAEPRCPFCRQGLPGDLPARAIPGTTQRLGRSAMFTFAASVALGACSSATTMGPEDAAGDSASATADGGGDTGPRDTGNIAPPYGFPATDSGVPRDTAIPQDTAVPQDSSIPRDSSVPRDTAVPEDTAVPRDSGAPEDTGAIAPPYGFPATDSGVPRDSGGVMPLYGLPTPVDSGTPDTGTSDAGTPDTAPAPRDSGGVVPLYGLPPAPDGGRDGSIGVRYGAPPL